MIRQNLLVLILAALLAACAGTIEPHSESASYTLSPPVDSPVWKAFHEQLPDANASISWFFVLNTGQEALLKRLALIDSAETSIDAQYFLWLEDAVGALLFERLLAAADRGVRVRLLMDDSFLANEDSTLLAFEHHPNIKVRIYNPFDIRSTSMAGRYVENLHDFSRTNHRMHNKLLIGDTTFAIVGGRNIADEYFGFGQTVNYRDFDLLAAGSVIPELASSFDLFWNSGWAFPIPEIDHKYASDTDLIALKKDLRTKASSMDQWQTGNDALAKNWTNYWAELAGSMIPGQAKLLLDKPHFEQELPTQVAQSLLHTYRDAEEDVLAISAYLIMTDELLNSTQWLNDKGVKVSFLTNSLASTNHIAAHSAYRHHRKALLKTGASLFTMRPDADSRSLYRAPGFTAERLGLHGKVVVLDSNKVFIGTLNLDPRSMFLNTEMGLMIESPELNAAIRKVFTTDFSLHSSWQLKLDHAGKIQWHSHDGVLNQQPAGNMLQRTMDFIFGLFPIDSEM